MVRISEYGLEKWKTISIQSVKSSLSWKSTIPSQETSKISLKRDAKPT